MSKEKQGTLSFYVEDEFKASKHLIDSFSTFVPPIGVIHYTNPPDDDRIASMYDRVKGMIAAMAIPDIHLSDIPRNAVIPTPPGYLSVESKYLRPPPLRAGGEFEMRFIRPLLSMHRTKFRGGKKIKTSFTAKQLGLADESFLSKLRSSLIDFSPFTEDLIPEWALEDSKTWQGRFDAAMKDCPFKEHFVLGMDVFLLRQYTSFPETSPGFIGPVIKRLSFRAKNFKKAYSQVVANIEAIRF